jgi:glycosyltransferase involved in cell wall biosynthesis
VNPTVSVIIPNYNHEVLVGRAINSVLAQGDDVLEVIVIDDASTDDSVRVIEATLRGNPTVRLLRNVTNRGVIATLNRGIEEARGDFVLLGAADDIYLPGMIATCLRAADSCPDVGFVCGNAIVRWPDGSQLSVSLPFGDTPRYISPDEVVAVGRQRNFFFYTGSALLRRKAILAAGLLPELRWNADWLLDFVLALRHGVYYVPEEFSVVATSPESYSQGRRNWHDQRRILEFLIPILHQHYSDVLPRFREAALLPSFHIDFLWPLLTDPVLRRYATPLLVWRMIAFRPLQYASRIVSWSMRQRLRVLLRM